MIRGIYPNFKPFNQNLNNCNTLKIVINYKKIVVKIQKWVYAAHVLQK